jgi:alpha-N-arabinofuranosidase
MSPDFYSDQFKRYATYCMSYPGAPLKKIASGANGDDYNWTDVCMKKIYKNDMWGISMHYYTIAGDWAHKGSATQFDENTYFAAIKSCLHIEDLVNKHSAIMDKYDPEKKVALAVDEWGIWTDVEPGTNGAFLYQQNSMRDALIAASTLNIFNNHADRVRMACIAQTVNVLQALILTNKEKMVLTPTYHVFDLYKVHQDAALLPVQFFSPDYVYGKDKVPAINASASKDKDGVIHISLVNVDAHNSIKINAALQGIGAKSVTGQIITSGAFNDINTFDNPNKVKPAAFTGFTAANDNLGITMPPLSVVVLEVK